MPEQTAATPLPRRRRRRRLLLLIFVIALPVAAFVLLRWALQPERLGALLLSRAAEAIGLELSVTEPARLGIWPQLQLELVGLSARADTTEPPLLRVERVDVSLPLSLLWRRDEIELGDVHLRAPELDLDAWQRWRERDEPGPQQPLQLPAFAIELQVSRGQVQASGWSIEAINLGASPLREGQPFAIQASSDWHDGDRIVPISLRMSTHPRNTERGVVIDDLSLQLGGADMADVIDLTGTADIAPPEILRIDLTGQMSTDWPATWPPLPEHIAPYLLGHPVTLSYAGRADFSGEARLESRSEQHHLVVATAPLQLAAWFAADPRPPLPPLTAMVQLDTVQLPGVRLKGVSVRLDPDPSPEPPPDPSSKSSPAPSPAPATR